MSLVVQLLNGDLQGESSLVLFRIFMRLTALKSKEVDETGVCVCACFGRFDVACGRFDVARGRFDVRVAGLTLTWHVAGLM